jgi:hypothetical protein
VLHESSAWFTADAGGILDQSKQKPDSGSYNIIDSMGLHVSMKSRDPQAMEKIAQNISMDESMFIDIQAECGQERASVKLDASSGPRRSRVRRSWTGSRKSCSIPSHTRTRRSSIRRQHTIIAREQSLFLSGIAIYSAMA